MSPWLLLVVLCVVWFLWFVAEAAELAASEAARGVPENQREGVPLLPAVPLFPLLFWAIALLVDLFADPWGTVAVGSLHALLAVWFILSLARNWWRLRSLDRNG